mmetsp:Transcript_12867/g.18989  ORF Transcript_12867/g.18989 Transcript_12867/m.18989 type:complete len:260 (+) Transcript_12867:1258-2037(+)
MLSTEAVWPCRVRRHSYWPPGCRDHRRTVRSALALARQRSTGENRTFHTPLRWPRSVARAVRVAPPPLAWVAPQSLTVLSWEALATRASFGATARSLMSFSCASTLQVATASASASASAAAWAEAGSSFWFFLFFFFLLFFPWAPNPRGRSRADRDQHFTVRSLLPDTMKVWSGPSLLLEKQQAPTAWVCPLSTATHHPPCSAEGMRASLPGLPSAPASSSASVDRLCRRHHNRQVLSFELVITYLPSGLTSTASTESV